MDQIKKLALIRQKRRQEKALTKQRRESNSPEKLQPPSPTLPHPEKSQSLNNILLENNPNLHDFEVHSNTQQIAFRAMSYDLKNFDPNNTAYLQQEQLCLEQLNKQFDEIVVPPGLKQEVWNAYKNELSKAERSFYNACVKGDLIALEKFLDSRASRLPVSINTAFQDNKNCLHVVIESSRDMDVIRRLVACQADFNHKNKSGRTPLMLACIKDWYECAKYLIDIRCDLNIQDEVEGNTALHYCCSFSREQIAEYLILKGAKQDINNNLTQKPSQLCTNPAILQFFDKEIVQKTIGNQYQRTVVSEHVVFPNSRQDHVKRLLELTGQGHSIRESANGSETQIVRESQGHFALSPRNSTQAVSKKKRSTRFELIANIRVDDIKQANLLDFRQLDILGKGAFGCVYLVEHQETKMRYAMKVLNKLQIQQQKLLKYALTQRKILSTVLHPFIVKLSYAFQTQDKLILIMDYCPGGDLLEVIRKQKKLDEKSIKKYAAEIVLALECLHKAEIIYRDLKPANVVIDREGHACLTDFGLSKEAEITHSFCGSLAYLAPEMLSRRGHTKSLDWYLLGVLIYECYTGRPPFFDTSKEQLLTNIKIGRYRPVEGTTEFKDILAQLLKSNPSKRLGSERDAEEVKAHPWFKDVDWGLVEARKQEMPVPQNPKQMFLYKNKSRVPMFTAEEVEKGKSVNHVEQWQFS